MGLTKQADVQFLELASSTEQSMAHWWMTQAAGNGQLFTVENEHLLILDCGRVNDGAGPDILDAKIMIEDYLHAGPVEFHRTSTDWYSHGHGEDPAYVQVILHVVQKFSGSPDLPTLVLPEHTRQSLTCAARRRPTDGEIQGAGFYRLMKKRQRGKRLQTLDLPADLIPLTGLLESMASGRDRHRLLHMLAPDLDLESWPLLDPWQGSRRDRGALARRLERMRTFVEKCPGIVPPAPIDSLTDVDHYLNVWAPIVKRAGVPSVHIGEWLTNTLVPWYGSSFQNAAQLWGSLRPPRHYGLERRLSRWWQIALPTSVLQQQGWLGWWQKYCVRHDCVSCPLVRDVSTLAELN